MAVKCPACHYENPDTQRFCGECGTPLTTPLKTSLSRTKSLRISTVAKGTTFVGRYKILEQLGRGGMGMVYKAQDLKLKRPVALKFLAPELTQDKEAKERFVQEAQAASALDHPNICTIHEIDEAKDGRMYITMGFCEGESLRERIERGPLEVDEAVGIARQVAEGLARAHAKGIIHRDIKPANIMIGPDGLAKIVDFGLAKLAGQVKLTRTGTTVGTVAYMSPEQARGEETDQRTDIWSLGVVLYEMLTGRLPFHGEGAQGVIYSILNREPEPPGRARPGLPGPVERIVLKALVKERTRRYLSMDELLRDLKAPQAADIVLPKAEKSIVILPFENISPEPEQDYFCDGMTEEIITDLSKIHSLRVISRTSAMMLKGTKKDVQTIARELNVQYVLEGSVRKTGNNIRITAQLIDAAMDAHLWAEKYSGTLEDVFDIQEKVAGSIVGALRLKLSPDEKERMAERPIDNLVAYESFIKANAEVYKFTEEAINRALLLLEKAAQITGDNALVYSGMAWAYWNLVNIGVKQEEYIEKAEACVQRALSLDPSCAKAHVVMGGIKFFTGNQQEAVRHFKQAIAADPSDSMGWQGLTAIYTETIGKIAEAVPTLERLIQVDPLNLGTLWTKGSIYFYDGKFDTAALRWAELLTMDPENPMYLLYYAMSLVYTGRTDEAIAFFDKNARLSPDTAMAKVGLLFKYALQKDRERVFEVMSPDFQNTTKRDPAYSYYVASALALLGAKKEALDWLENAVDRGYANYPLLAKKDHILATIRGEERFQKLAERAKHAWEHFEV